MNHDLKQAVKQFQLYGDYRHVEPYGSGHINDTYRVTLDQSGREVRYLLQRINHHVFKDPPALMENIVRVTKHIQGKLLDAGVGDISRRVLKVILTRRGENCYLDTSGNYWRCYCFIENARTYDVPEMLDQISLAAKAFGRFQSHLSNLAEPPLHETIPDFHNALKRYQTFLQALDKDPHNRAISAKAEIDFLNANIDLFNILPELVKTGKIPVRTTHNDTKINNVMIDDQTSEGICVIDLDTVMPGLSLYDFGDIVRTTISSSPEDEQDLSKVIADLSRFEAVVKGYLDGAGSFLNSVEIDHLVHAAKLITMVIGTRFLTDYLDGDHYFKVHREGHNLDRCRSQFKIVQSIIEQQERMNQVVKNCYQKIV